MPSAPPPTPAAWPADLPCMRPHLPFPSCTAQSSTEPYASSLPNAMTTAEQSNGRMSPVNSSSSTGRHSQPCRMAGDNSNSIYCHQSATRLPHKTSADTKSCADENFPNEVEAPSVDWPLGNKCHLGVDGFRSGGSCLARHCVHNGTVGISVPLAG